MFKNSFLLIIIFISSYNVHAQIKDYELGSPGYGMQNRQGGYFDYSEPDAINIKVSVWGFVRYPGRYVIPINTTVSDLISYAGGPTDDAELRDLRLYRVSEDSSHFLYKFSYNDLLWEENLEEASRNIPNLQATDILLVPGSERLYFDDWLNFSLRIFTALTTFAILLWNILRK